MEPPKPQKIRRPKKLGNPLISVSSTTHLLTLWEDFASAYTPFALPIGAIAVLIAVGWGLSDTSQAVVGNYFLQHLLFGKDARPEPPPPSTFSAAIHIIVSVICLALAALSAAVLFFGPKHVFTSSWGNIVYSFKRPHMDENETNQKLVAILESNPDADIKEYQNALSILIHHIDRKPITPTSQSPSPPLTDDVDLGEDLD
jgi:hypothetical protein